MKNLIGALFLALGFLFCVSGCDVLKTVPPETKLSPTPDKMFQDAQFQQALDQLADSSSKEVGLLEEQSTVLARIEASVEALAKPVADVEDVPLPKADPVPKSADEAVERPKLWVTYADFNCPPCDRLKEAIEEGKLDAFEIILDEGEGLKSSRPAIKFEYGASSTGYGVIYEYSDSVLNWLNGNLLQGDPQSISSDSDPDATEHTVISFSKPNSVKSTVTKTRSRSIVRNSGPSWNWEGSWNVSDDYAKKHLMQSHGVDASGLTMKDMEILHDNAHNSNRVSVQKSNTSYRNYSGRPVMRFFQRARSSCPGGNCP